MGFSICIPNYNYEQYLGITLESVLQQSNPNFEIVVADNQSTDRSVAIIAEYAAKHPDAEIRWQINKTNLGFAGNLDQVAQMAKQPYLIMLSSDDVVKSEALATYQKLIDQLPKASTFILTSAIDTIDSEGQLMKTTYAKDAYRQLWQTDDKEEQLSAALGFPVYKVPSSLLLKRMIQTSSNPFNFCATCYPFEEYEAAGGYGGSRLMNPDKWFHWRLLTKVEYAYFLDYPLFQYRWHAKNQTAQEKNSGHLKFIVDEYRTSMEANRDLLNHAQLTTKEVQQAFIDNIIFRHGLAELSKGLWLKSFRIYFFGWAAYPKIMFSKAGKSLAYKLLLLTGPIGIFLLKSFRSWRNPS